MGKDSSGTIYLAFHNPGQIRKIRDCPGDSGTVGAYVFCNIMLKLVSCFCVYFTCLSIVCKKMVIFHYGGYVCACQCEGMCVLVNADPRPIVLLK